MPPEDVPQNPADTAEATELLDAGEPAAEERSPDELMREAAKSAADAVRAKKKTSNPTEEPEATPPPETAPEVPKAKARLDGILKQREDEQRTREKVREQVTQELGQRFDAERKAIIEQARKEATRDAVERLRTSPADFVKDAGIDPKAMLGEWGQLASPEAQLQRKIAEIEARVGKAPKELEDRLARIEQLAQAGLKADAERAQSKAHSDFLAQCTDEKTPYLRAIYDTDADIMRRAQEVADEYCKKTGETYCPFGDLRDYLEEEAKTAAVDAAKAAQTRTAKLSKLLQEVPGVKGLPTEANGRTGQRTLSAKGASERRASPKPPATEAEMTEAMLEAARGAIKSART